MLALGSANVGKYPYIDPMGITNLYTIPLPANYIMAYIVSMQNIFLLTLIPKSVFFVPPPLVRESLHLLGGYSLCRPCFLPQMPPSRQKCLPSLHAIIQNADTIILAGLRLAVEKSDCTWVQDGLQQSSWKLHVNVFQFVEMVEMARIKNMQNWW